MALAWRRLLPLLLLLLLLLPLLRLVVVVVVLVELVMAQSLCSSVAFLGRLVPKSDPGLVVGRVMRSEEDVPVGLLSFSSPPAMLRLL